MKANNRTVIFCLVAVVVLLLLYFWHGKTTSPTTQPAAVTSAPLPQVAAWPADEIKKQEIKESGDGYTIDVFYPQTQSGIISGYLQDFATGEVSDFKQNISWITDPTIPKDTIADTSLAIDYTTEKSANAETYIFAINSDTGGAHGMSTTETFTYLKDGTPITLKNLFTNETNGLNALSAYAIKQLKQENISDDSWIATGAGPTEDNYESFSLGDNEITIYFDPYQVADYAAGAQTVTVPFSALSPYLNPMISQ